MTTPGVSHGLGTGLEYDAAHNQEAGSIQIWAF